MNSQAAVHAQQLPHVLSSWKEIAAFLGKDVRTVQRWERCLGLPVHRTGGNGAAVLAYPAEIDAWRQKQRIDNKFRDKPTLATARLAEPSDVLQSMLALAYFLS